MSDEKYPLVSMCVMSCNQRAYIAKALRAVFDQDYPSLEIVISDDGSKDGTWELVRQMAAAYRGPHRIILNRNEPNLGTIGNWQKLCELSHGELLVKVDGDDISSPTRARTLAEDWVASGRRAVMMASSYDVIDAQDAVIGEKIMPGGWDTRSAAGIAGGAEGRFYLGAVMACHRSLFDDFPRVRHLRSSDCSVYEARGLLSRFVCHQGEIVRPFRMVSEKLVKYRLGSGDTTGGGYRNFMAKGANRVLEARLQTLEDLEEARAYLPADYIRSLEAIYQSHVEHQRRVLALYAGTFSQRLAAYVPLSRLSGRFTKAGLIYLLFLLPRRLGDFLFTHLRH